VLRPRSNRSLVLAAGLLCATAAHALEHVTLNNGFSYDCARHENIGDHVRLYFSASDDFQEIPASSVTAIETLPDPPAAKPATETPARSASSTSIPALLNTVSSAINIDVALLAAVIHAESGGRIRAVSRTGAQGLMQLMPGTASQLGVHDAFRPEENIAAGTAYLDALLKRYDPRDDAHGLALALAAYNAGPAAVDRYHGIPPYRETRAYVARVMNEYKRRRTTTTIASQVTSVTQPAH